MARENEQKERQTVEHNGQVSEQIVVLQLRGCGPSVFGMKLVETCELGGRRRTPSWPWGQNLGLNLLLVLAAYRDMNFITSETWWWLQYL